MRVVLDLSCLMPPGGLTGVGYYTLRLVETLLARGDGVEYCMFASSAGPASERVRKLAPAFHRAHVMRWPTRMKVQMWTRREWPPIEWFAGPVDVAHGAFHLLPAARKARRSVTVFDLSPIMHPETHDPAQVRLHRRMLEHAAHRADLLVALSQSCRDELVAILRADPERVAIVPGAVSLKEFSGGIDYKRLRVLKDSFGIRRDYFLHVGTVQPRKNLPRLIEAYGHVRKRLPECPQLVLAGHVDGAAVGRINLAGGVGEAVRCTGYLSREDAVLLLRGAYACVYPSLYEGFGLPILEAMAARVPVLTSNVSSMPEVAGDTALLVDPLNVDSIEAGLIDLIEERDASLARLAPAYERASRFTWENSAAALAAAHARLVP